MKSPARFYFIFSFIVILLVGIGARLILEVVILGGELRSINLLTIIILHIAIAVSCSIPIAYGVKKKNDK